MWKLFLDTDHITHSLVALLLSVLLVNCLLLRETEREDKVQAPALEQLCEEFREQLVRQVQIWGFEHQGSFNPAFGLCNRKERTGKVCLD